MARLPSVACETSDWSHVDVYLTKTLDYRMLLLGGSRWQGEPPRWTAERQSTVIAVGDPMGRTLIRGRPETILSLVANKYICDDQRVL
ncbi:MAG TPA: hypothetical protein VNF47_24055 [Streptosporangiaceae bacterium]|nr:hypothetical protein [Streptosporangiaceae bacterium]